MPNWDSLGWLLAIGFVIGFGFTARFIYKAIKAHREKKDTLV